jgi:hypothetical protein
MSVLFPPEFISGLPQFDRLRRNSTVVVICRLPQYQAYRERLQGWYSHLPDSVQSQFTRRLQDYSSYCSPHDAAAFELYLHECFLQKGWRPEYQSPLAGKTPDFAVRDSRGELLFYCEALMVGEPECDQAQHRVMQELECELNRRLSERGTVVLLGYEAVPGKDPGVATLAQSIAAWAAHTADGDMTRGGRDFELPGLRVTVHAMRAPSGPSRAVMGTSGPGSWRRDIERLREKVDAKAKGYPTAVPLVVAVGCDAVHRLHEDEATEALYGTVAVAVDLDPRGGTPLSSPYAIRKEDGVLVQRRDSGIIRRPQVSAVLLCERRGSPTDIVYASSVFHAVAPTQPLPQELFADNPQFCRVKGADGKVHFEWVRPAGGAEPASDGAGPPPDFGPRWGHPAQEVQPP